jgi:histidinol phosphatase-like enzyme
LKAVFVKRDCIESPRTSATGEDVRLHPGVAEGLKRLGAKGLFIIVLDATSCASEAESEAAPREAALQAVLGLVHQGGGRLDALLQCPHRSDENCGCWGSYPGFLYAAAAQLDLRLDECYLLCNESNDVLLAYKVGCRPILILDGHSISDLYDGHQPEPRDFPIAKSFSAAVHYVLLEEQANEQWGHPRLVPSFSQLDEEATTAEEAPQFSPQLRLISPVPGARAPLLAGLPQMSVSARRFVLLFVLGGVWLSLGIAYILTHLYRVQPFPEFVWYLTLQFIPRPVRGLLFIATGAVVVISSLRAFMHLLSSNRSR